MTNDEMQKIMHETLDGVDLNAESVQNVRQQQLDEYQQQRAQLTDYVFFAVIVVAVGVLGFIGYRYRKALNLTLRYNQPIGHVRYYAVRCALSFITLLLGAITVGIIAAATRIPFPVLLWQCLPVLIFIVIAQCSKPIGLLRKAVLFGIITIGYAGLSWMLSLMLTYLLPILLSDTPQQAAQRAIGFTSLHHALSLVLFLISAGVLARLISRFPTAEPLFTQHDFQSA